MNRNTITIALAVFWLLTLVLFIETKGGATRLLLPIVTVVIILYAIFITVTHFVKKPSQVNEPETKTETKTIK